MLRKKPTRKDNRYEYKLTLGRDIHGKPLRKSFYSTVSLSDAKKKAEEYRVASEVSARTGEAFVTSTYKQPFVDVNTYELTYVSLVEGHLIPYFGGGAVERYSSGGHTGVLRHKDGMFGEPAEEMNCTPFVRQYDILSNRWGDLLCQEENQTNDTRRNLRSWSWKP